MPFYRDWLLIPIVGIVYALDQLTKLWVESNLCHARSIPAEGPFQLTCSFNTGSAFGLFPDQTILLILASFVGVGVLLFVYRHHPVPGPLVGISLGLQLGGAVGNLTDRLRFGQVTDFVKLGPWPVFNLADASIVVGVIMLVWLFVFSGDRSKKKPHEVGDDAQMLEDTSAAAHE
ncbi:MAG: signal peptidase II, partial [Dehalococcoidia bacterium]